jgi:hypothetical protein
MISNITVRNTIYVHSLSLSIILPKLTTNVCQCVLRQCLNFCKRARAFWLIVAMLHHFMREQEIFGWNWGGEHKEAYLNFGAIICPITEVLHFLSHSWHSCKTNCTTANKNAQWQFSFALVPYRVIG